ncbi:MAG: cytochrome c family protein [Desulfobacterales bacterium]|nr:cytochrome c family protein [Deltaproteobacteria bacterium]NNL77766.1 cytochrome c family protein [Desulfobacterales bacterium]
MIKKVFLTLLALVFVVSTVGVGLAVDRGNKRKGKYTYRKVYKACYERGNVESKTPPISPADKTQAEWTTIFESEDFTQFGCQEEWEKLTQKDMSDIYTYMHDHAFDSPTPAKCK